MPAEAEGRAKDVEVWNLVIYLRSLLAAAAAGAGRSREVGFRRIRYHDCGDGNLE